MRVETFVEKKEVQDHILKANNVLSNFKSSKDTEQYANEKFEVEEESKKEIEEDYLDQKFEIGQVESDIGEEINVEL